MIINLLVEYMLICNYVE